MCIRDSLEEVRVLTEQMSQPNQSNVSAEVSRVFGRLQDKVIQARASIKMYVLQVPRILGELQT